MEYLLKDSFEVSQSGEKVDAEKISIPAPNNLVLKDITVIDSEFNAAIMAMSKNVSGDQKQEEEKEPSGKDLVLMLSGSKADMAKCYVALRNIMVKQGKINESISVTEHIFNKMSFQDTKLLLGEYIKDFLYSSLVA